MDKEKELHGERIAVERKVFFFDLKENDRGRFLKIVEDVGGRRDMIIVPATGLPDFINAIQAAMDANNELPSVESRPPSEGDNDLEDV